MAILYYKKRRFKKHLLNLTLLSLADTASAIVVEKSDWTCAFVSDFCSTTGIWADVWVWISSCFLLSSDGMLFSGWLVGNFFPCTCIVGKETGSIDAGFKSNGGKLFDGARNGPSVFNVDEIFDDAIGKSISGKFVFGASNGQLLDFERLDLPLKQEQSEIDDDFLVGFVFVSISCFFFDFSTGTSWITVTGIGVADLTFAVVDSNDDIWDFESIFVLL